MATVRKRTANREPESPRTIQSRAEEALLAARKGAKSMKSWVELSNYLYGVGGVCGKLFPNSSDRAQFAKTPQYKQIAKVIEGLPRPASRESIAPSGQLRVRMPRSLHAALIAEAETEGTSLNQLILSKLSLQLKAIVQTG